MSKKEELDKEDLKFLKKFLGESKKEENRVSDLKIYKKMNKKLSVNSIKDDLIQLDKKSQIINRLGAIELKFDKTDLNHPHSLEKIEGQPSLKKKRKIKKKELFLEIAETLPLIKQNNALLNKLIQALIQEPIKVKLLKE